MTGGVTGNDLTELTATRRRQVATAVIVLALAVVPFITTDYVTEIAFTGLVFVMLGVSWNLLAGYAGQVSLGHAAFFGIGAFVTAWLTTPARAGLPEAIQMPMIASLPIAAVAAGLVALVLGPVIFRLSGHYFAIGTLALATIIQLLLLDQRAISGGSTGYYISSGLDADFVYLIGLVSTVGMIVVAARVVNSRIGLGMRAVHGDEDAASSLGVHPLRYKLWAFGISSAMAGLAGALWAQFTLYVNPESTLGVIWMIDTLVVVILGGMGTMLGPLLGAALFLTLDTGLRSIAGEFATTVEGALIILFILFAPAGVYGLLESRIGNDEEPAAPPEESPETTGQAE